jgi:hypothetical protein
MRLLPSLERTIIPDTFTRFHQKPFPARYIQARFFELMKIIITIRKNRGKLLVSSLLFLCTAGFYHEGNYRKKVLAKKCQIPQYRVIF